MPRHCPVWRIALAQFNAWRRHLKADTTVEGQKQSLEAFMHQCPELAEKSVDSVTLTQVDAFINTDKPLRIASRYQRRCALIAFFKFCNGQGWTNTNYAVLAEIKKRDLPHELWVPKPRIAITPDEYNLIMANTSGFWHYASAISYWAGLRLGDVCTLEWQAITADSIIVMVRKSERPLALPLKDPIFGHGALIPIFMEMLERRQSVSQYCFPSMRERYRISAQRVHISYEFTDLLKRLGKARIERAIVPDKYGDAGFGRRPKHQYLPIYYKCFHCLRHSFAARFKATGRNIEELAKMMSHASIETTKGYGT